MDLKSFSCAVFHCDLNDGRKQRDLHLLESNSFLSTNVLPTGGQ